MLWANAFLPNILVTFLPNIGVRVFKTDVRIYTAKNGNDLKFPLYSCIVYTVIHSLFTKWEEPNVKIYF